MQDDPPRRGDSNPALRRRYGELDPPDESASQAEILHELGMTLAAFLAVALAAGLIAGFLGAA